MKAIPLAFLTAFALVAVATAQDPAAPAAMSAASANQPAVVMEYSNARLSPSHWTLTLHPDGSGYFRSEMGSVIDTPGKLRTPSISRAVKLSQTFAASAFQSAQRHSFFNMECESHMKVAYQGDKTLAYSGPDGKGTCTFNYSKDREIQTLADNFGAVAETIIEGARLEVLLQHDPLGLDREIQSLVDAAQSGRAQQLCVIRTILERLAADDHVLDLVRKRAKSLLARAET